VWCSMKSGSYAEYSSGHMCPANLVPFRVSSHPPPMMPCIQPCGSSSCLDQREKVLVRKAISTAPVRLADWTVNIRANSSCWDGAVALFEAGQRIVSLISLH